MCTRAYATRLLFILILCVTGVVAAATPSHAAAIGAQVGADLSGIDGDTPPNTSYSDRIGLIAGIQGEIGFAHDLLVSLQPSYVQKKSALQFTTGPDAIAQRELTFDFVSVPLLLKFAKANGRTYVAGGVTVDFLSAARLSGGGSDQDVKSSFKSTAADAVLGFGVVFPAGHTHFTTELRYVQGLTNLNTGEVAANAGALAPRLHTTGWELIVGDLIPVGRR